MVDAAFITLQWRNNGRLSQILFYGQDVGRRLGGVFREATTLAEKFGDHRVYNTAIQEAYIIGSTMGLSALGIKPHCRDTICRLYLSRAQSIGCRNFKVLLFI